MKKLMHILLLSCLKATEFIEKKIHYKLSFRENIQLKLHTMMCKACSVYEEQSELIEKVVSSNKTPLSNKEDLTSLKKSIVEKISTN